MSLKTIKLGVFETIHAAVYLAMFQLSTLVRRIISSETDVWLEGFNLFHEHWGMVGQHKLPV